MELEYVLSWVVAINGVVMLAIHLWHFKLKLSGWVGVYVFLLAVLLTGTLADVAFTGYAAFALWIALVLVPVYASRRLMQVTVRHHFEDAARFATLAGWFHPFDGVPDQARYLRAQARIDEGDFEGARALLEQLTRSSALGELARVELLRIDQRWGEIVGRVGSRAPGTRDLRLLPLYLRALGETGAVSSMCELYTHLPSNLQRVAQLRLTLATFTGRPDLVERLLSGPLKGYPQRRKAFWLASAEQAAGNPEAAEGLLEPLAKPGSRQRREALHRLQHPLETVQPLADEAETLLSSLEQSFTEERHLPDNRARRKVVATWALIASLAGVFLWGTPSGSEDIENLVSMGALVLPPELVDGELYWRIIAAGFLHFGSVHLVMNLLGLWVLGRDVERVLGTANLLICYFGASIGSYLFAALTVTATVEAPRVFLGASAGVLGLVGALASFSFIGYKVGKNRAFRRRLGIIGLIIVLQMIFDWFTPMVASQLHISGLALGALLATPMALRFWRRSAA